MNLSIAELKKTLAIRTKKAAAIRTKIDKLETKKGRLQNQLDEILGGKAGKTKVVRQKRRKVKVKARQKVKRVRSKSGTLKESLVKVLTQTGKPLHIDDILKGLKAVGHKTASKDIKKIAGVRLYTDKEFLKTAPGTFTLKAMGAKAPVKNQSATGKKTKKGDLPF